MFSSLESVSGKLVLVRRRVNVECYMYESESNRNQAKEQQSAHLQLIALKWQYFTILQMSTTQKYGSYQPIA